MRILGWFRTLWDLDLALWWQNLLRTRHVKIICHWKFGVSLNIKDEWSISVSISTLTASWTKFSYQGSRYISFFVASALRAASAFTSFLIWGSVVGNLTADSSLLTGRICVSIASALATLSRSISVLWAIVGSSESPESTSWAVVVIPLCRLASSINSDCCSGSVVLELYACSYLVGAFWQGRFLFWMCQQSLHIQSEFENCA